MHLRALIFKFTLFTSLVLHSNVILAAQCTASSGTQRARLIELYTSEGCDSCPPADKWLSALKPEAQIVPLAFHVDYWDYIGWKDRFASPAFGERQRLRVAAQGSRSVYTPQIMVDGGDVNWRAITAKQLAMASPAPIRLEVKASIENSVVSIAPAASAIGGPSALEGAKFYFALFENNIYTEVKAGENRGVKLRHDYVVRQWVGPVALGAQKLVIPKDAQAAHLGVAMIAENKQGGLLQAIALPLAGCH
jgi:hypothetical protein